MKKILPVVTIVIALLMFAQQYIFFLRIPLTVITPLVGLFGFLIALRINKGRFKFCVMIGNAVVMCIFPVYILLIFIFPDLFV
jgi:hypothetical protein